MTDDDLFHAMFSSDPVIASAAKALYDFRHASDPPAPEPPHCEECFEGCPKCQPEQFSGINIRTKATEAEVRDFARLLFLLGAPDADQTEGEPPPISE